MDEHPGSVPRGGSPHASLPERWAVELAYAAQPIISSIERQAKHEVLTAVARDYNLSLPELLGRYCPESVPGPSDGFLPEEAPARQPRRSGTRRSSGGSPPRRRSSDNGAERGRSSARVDRGYRMLESMRTELRGKGATPYAALQAVLDGADQVMGNLVELDHAHDAILEGEYPSALLPHLKSAIASHDTLMCTMNDNISQLAGTLNSVFPPHVVEQLKSDMGDIADAHASVSVLMCDVVGFTAWCADTPPKRVIECLSAYFQILDDIAESLGVYKVETIGDGYQAICGHDPNVKVDNHAVAMCTFALQVIENIPQMRKIFENDEFNVRVGINSGPIVTGVIRADRPRWQLFGDTVNHASRMESTSLPGRVQISRSTYDIMLLGSAQFKFERRGLIEVKGKGQQETFFVLGHKDSAGLLRRQASFTKKRLAVEDIVGEKGEEGSKGEVGSPTSPGPKVGTPSASPSLSMGHSVGSVPEDRAVEEPTVLLVDDMLSILLQLARMLQKENLDVTTAREGASALELLQQRSFTVVLCDIHMPKMGGIEMVTKFREWEWSARPGRRQHIYALTGDIEPEAKRRYLEAGFDGTLAKTGSKEEILTAIKDAKLTEQDAGGPPAWDSMP